MPRTVTHLPSVTRPTKSTCGFASNRVTDHQSVTERREEAYPAGGMAKSAATTGLRSFQMTLS
jgi:hypothetical protein